MFLRGKQTLDLTVKEGGPLPFAYDILTSAFEYGNRAFTKYPEEIPDYFKQTFPEGYSWERSMIYEDGGVCTASSDIRLVRWKAVDSRKGNLASCSEGYIFSQSQHLHLCPIFISYYIFVEVYP